MFWFALVEFVLSARGLVVMIVACQVMDPGSIPGERKFFMAVFGFVCCFGVCFFCVSKFPCSLVG